MTEAALQKEENMSLRDIAGVELFLLVLIAVIFLAFFGMYLALRYKQRQVRKETFTRKRQYMQEAIDRRAEQAGPVSAEFDRWYRNEERMMNAKMKQQNQQEEKAGKECLKGKIQNAGYNEQRDTGEVRRISHRRDQLKRLEEQGQI